MKILIKKRSVVVGIAKLIDLLEYSIIMNWDLIPEKYVVFRFLYPCMYFE